MKFLGLALTSVLALTALLVASPAIAQSENGQAQAAEQSEIEARAEQVVPLVNGEIDPQDIFTDGFLNAVPLSELTAFSQQITAQFGPAISVESLNPSDGTRAAIAIRMERAIARGGIAIDPNDDNRISELVFQTFEPINDTPAKIAADLSALPGEVTWWFGPLDGTSPIMASESDDPMALGSTFKLYVLAALARDVAQGKRNWDDVVTLGAPRSFPSGAMQDWPADARVTLETLASMMISISDNTATDALMQVLGREAVMQAMIESGHANPLLNDPFITTREMFMLKGGPSGRLETYASGDADLRRQILAGLEENAVPVEQIQAAFSQGPIALDVEWFGSAADLRGLMAFMRETADPRAFEIMAINPSMSDNTRDRWSYAGYKGGSEPGVLNLTWLLTDAEGVDHALVLSWTNREANLDEDALELIAQRILQLER